ncbi:MAG: FkbM family methyltransferase [Cytophagales bacterium]|nr:FkbM family methyltransferase [Cytophagales bacterium]
MKDQLKRMFHRMGVQVTKYQAHTTEEFLLQQILQRHRVDYVLDVGANTGAYGKTLRKYGYRGNIISFEPLTSAWTKLSDNARGDARWTVADRMALGNYNGNTEINIAGNSESSSVLPMEKSHWEVAPDSKYIAKEPVPVRRLDDYLAEKGIGLSPNVYLKIDTQGFESQVLAGAANTLDKTVGLELELSLLPLYEGQLLYQDLIRILNGKGFQLWSMFPVFTDPATGRLLQFNGFFVKSKA